MERLVTAIIDITAHFTSMQERLEAEATFEDALNELIDERIQKALAEIELHRPMSDNP
jgi:hypothetical protein